MSVAELPRTATRREPRAGKGEPTIRDRLGERPEFSLARIREVRGRDLAIRFAAGALTSVAAGVVSLIFGARVGGILLAFPAILAASLTLIEEEEDGVDAREDSRGAVAGGLALAVFAAVSALSFTHWPLAAVLGVAAAAWALAAGALYALAWFGRS